VRNVEKSRFPVAIVNGCCNLSVFLLVSIERL
jgi:hypothetical protein